MSNSKHTAQENRIFSPDAQTLMAMLPQGLAEEWIEKSFFVFGRTKAELAAPDLLAALEKAQQYVNVFILRGEEPLLGESIKDDSFQIIQALNKAK